jgi:tetratricopeptide (TPR) repeat protein
MKFLAASFLIGIISFAGSSQDQNQKPTIPPAQSPAKSEVQLELESVAKLYKTGNFIEAQQHAERAVSLDPSNRTALVFLARVMHQRYQPRVETPENIELARAAIAVYQRILGLDWQDEEAYKAVAGLYQMIHADEQLSDWLLQRAQNPQFSYEKRAEAYVVLAGRFWDCSFKITELPDTKVVDGQGRKLTVTYQKPKDALEFEKLKQCVTNGLEMVEMALALNPNSESGWSYKTNLLIENAKVAEMDGMDQAKANYLKESKQAQAQTTRLATERRRREEEGSSDTQPNVRPSPQPKVPSPPLL